MRTGWLIAAIIVVSLTVGLAGCADGPTPATLLLEPRIAPPLIAREGVLMVGVPESRPPYSWVEDAHRRGIDVELAALIAEELGLRVEYRDLEPGSVVDGLTAGDVDIATSISLRKVSAAGVSVAGVYGAEAPAFYVRSEDASATLDAASLMGSRIGSQEGSKAALTIGLLAPDADITAYASVSKAFDALVAGEVDAVATDAAAGAFATGIYKDAGFAAQIAPASTLGVAAARDNPELAAAVQAIVDRAIADGRMALITRRHLGDIPALELDQKDPLAHVAAALSSTP